MKKLIAIAIAVALVPALSQAANTGNFDNVFGAIDTVMGLITKLIPIVIGAAVLVFLFGILKFIFAGDEEARKSARSFMIFGVIALFVMVSVWGLVKFLQSTFGLQGSATTPPPPPQVPVYGR
jgi:uncharacterized membrane-anchored protein